MKRLLHHPLTQRTRAFFRRSAATIGVIIAVALVSSLTVDLGPSLRRQAEKAASNYLERPMHIGRLGVHVWRGQFVVEDLVIEGLTPQSRPFLTAKRIDISMPWSTIFTRRVVFDEIEMSDWRMYVELFEDGRHSFPRFTRNGPRRQSAWTTTLEYVRAHRGEFEYEDHGTPWSTIARNLDVVVGRPTSEYRGRAAFSNGTVQVQKYEPMRADMSTTFRIVDGKILMDRINLDSDGARTTLNGVIDAGKWPEQTYFMRSHIQFSRMREIFFAHDDFTLGGEGDFTGTFHLFKETVNGKSRTGRELKGTFASANFGLNQYVFPGLKGAVRWVPESLDVTNASARLYGGTAGFSYRMAPLGNKAVPAVATFETQYSGVDLTALTAAVPLRGLRLAGRGTGRNRLEWPLGRFSAGLRGEGDLRVDAPTGAAMMPRAIPADWRYTDPPQGPDDPFDRSTPRDPVPLSGELSYTYDPAAITLGRSRVVTPSSYIEFEGRTEYGQRTRMPFHVTSGDWQESDRLLAGLMTAFGANTGAIPIGGFGTFDGTMEETFRRPKISGHFAGQRMRAFDVTWGTVDGDAVIENSYATVSRATIAAGASTMDVTGKFSLGFPRADGGDEIDALIRITDRPMTDLRHAFTLDDYDVDGKVSGEFRVYGKYLQPLGFGNMAINDGVAYDEPFESATGAVRLEGSGVRLDNIVLNKGGGRGVGAAYVAWESGTYSFQFNGTRIPVESVALVHFESLPALTGFIDFTAGGSGSFDEPRYDVRGTVRDFFVADEGIGQVAGTLSIIGDMMTVKVEAASPRLAVSGSGRVSLLDDMQAELTFTVTDTSLDPYVRVFQPDLSPFTTAVASGTIHAVGSLTDIDKLRVDTTVDQLDLRLFDYRLRNQAPVHAELEGQAVRIADLRLVGDGTELMVSGALDLHNERITGRASGAANLGILQGFVPNVRSSGQATLEAAIDGPMRDPLVSGTMRIQDGRIREFDLPHALEAVTGVVRFDSRGITLDELSARLGGGPVQFGGRIELQGYRPGRVDVTMRGEGMRLRFPEGMTSLVDATLTLQGTVDAATLGGNVVVRNALYRRPLEGGGSLFDIGGSTTAGATTGAAGAVGGAAPATVQTTIPLRYDVRLSVPTNLRVESRQLRLEASADLQLRGTFDKPLVFGRADIERGDFSFEGRRYLVTRGTVDFNNPTKIQPFFDIETETRVRVPAQTYRVTVRAVGTLERFTPEFTADPPLPEVEILSLLFSDVAPGRDVEFRQYSTVTPQEQLLRDRATRALTGVISSEVGRVVEQTFGVDTFQLTPSLIDPNAQSSRLDPAARVTIGKRLSDRVYLTYSRSLSASTRDQIVLLEYDQTDRFSWILSRNEDRTYALDVRVRHAF